MTNFHCFQKSLLTSSDLFSCKQGDKEPLQSYIQRFGQLKAQAPGVSEDVAIEAAILGLKIGQCASYLS